MSRRNPDDPLLFARAYRRFNGRPMVISPPLEAIYRDRHPFVAVQKPAQVGMTEYNLTMAFWASATNQGERGVALYLMPTTENVDRLSQRRLASAIEQSPSLKALTTGDPDGPRPPQRMHLRSIAKGVIYLSGSDRPAQYQGIDADIVLLDEFDQMADSVLPNAVPRLRSSQLAWMRVTSTPTIPGYGIHALVEESDDHHYEVHCPRCERWVEPSWPENVDLERGLVICHCRGPLPYDLPGRWVPRHPERGAIRGYQLNRLTLPNPPLAGMRLAASGTIGMSQEQFWRQDLGMPYVALDSRLGPAELDACRVDRHPNLDGNPPVVMGVDVGAEVFWVVVRAFLEGRSYLLCAERVEGGWEELERHLARYRPRMLFVDGLPDTRGAKWLSRRAYERHGCMTRLVYYKTTGSAHDWHFGRDDRKVTAVRTLAMDEMFDAFRQRRHLLPPHARDLADGDYYRHLQAPVRVIEPDAFGQPVAVYRHTKADDFAHAETYATLGATRWRRALAWD